MTLKIHMSIHNDDLHKTTAKRNVTNGVAGINSGGNIIDSSGNIAITDDKFKYYYNISDLSLQTHNNNIDITDLSYTKYKTITVNTLSPSPETLRIFVNTAVNGEVYVKIYKNGVAYGIEHYYNGVGWFGFSEDLSFAETDNIELYAYTTAGSIIVFIDRFEVKGTNTKHTLATAINGSNIGINIGSTYTNS